MRIDTFGIQHGGVEEGAMKSRSIRRSISNPLTGIMMPRTEDEYDAMVARLLSLCDEVKDDSDPRNRLIETLSVLTEKYEHAHHEIPDATPIEVLRFLMEQHQLTQSDLPEIGSQGVVSEILSGRRDLNLRQIQDLASHFGVDVNAFLPRTGTR